MSTDDRAGAISSFSRRASRGGNSVGCDPERSWGRRSRPKRVTLDPDVAAAVTALRRDGRGVSEVVNELARRGLAGSPCARPFVQEVSRMGRPRIPLDDVAAALDALEGVARSG